MTGDKNIVVFQNVSKVYTLQRSRVCAAKKLSFSIGQGEYVCIVGPSGGGKSTLMNIMGCLDTPSRGKYYLCGQDVSLFSSNALSQIRSRMIGFVFQQYHLLTRLTAKENVILPMRYAGFGPKVREARAKELLERVGLLHKANHYPSMLSGGEMQRVCIARALANRPALLLADEPTGALDKATGRKVMALLEEWNQEGNTLVLITHDETLAMRAPRIFHIRAGQIVREERCGKKTAQRRKIP